MVPALIWVFIMTFLFDLSFQVGRPLISLRLLEMDVPSATIGTVLSAAAIVPLLAGIPLGSVADRVGPRRVLAFGSAITALGYLALWQADGIISIGVSQAFAQCGVTACIIASQVLVAASGPPAVRAQNFGWFATAVTLSQLVGPPLGGTAADLWGIPMVFLGGALAGAVPLLIMPLLPADPPRGMELAPKEGGGFGGFHLLSIAELRYVFITALLLMLAFDIRSSFYPIYLSQSGLSKSQIGFLFTVMAMSGLSVRPMIGRLSERFGRWHLLGVAFVIAAPAFVLMPFAAGPVMAALTSAGIGLGVGLTQPLTMAITAASSPPGEQGLAMGLRLSAHRLGSVISPFLLGVVATYAGTGAAFIAAGLFTLAALGISILGSRVAAAGRLQPGTQARHQA